MAQPDMPELVVGSQLTGGSGYRIDYALVGYLTQALYDYQNKYFFSASFRRDGSSRFAPETRWGNFWSLGTSWRIDRESFMASTANWLSALTLKMSYGLTTVFPVRSTSLRVVPKTYFIPVRSLLP